MPEFRFSPLTTVEAGSATFQGVLMKYRSIGEGPYGKEVFLPGSFGNVEQAEILLNVQHDRSRPLARAPGTMQLVDSNSVLTLVAKPPATQEVQDARMMVQAKILTGLSIEFNATEQEHRNGVRVISKAQLCGVGLVDTPAFPASTVEARRQQHEQRARLSLTISGLIPYETKLDCRCQTGSCTAVRLKPKSLAQAAEPDSTALLVMGDYSKPIASVAKRSLQLTDTPQGLLVFSTIPDSQAGRDLIALASSVPLLIRPIFRQEDSAYEYEDNGETAVYEHMSLRGLTIGATDQAAGWPEAVISEPEAAPPATLEEPPQEARRADRWEGRRRICL